MLKVELEDVGAFDVEEGKRRVPAIEEDARVNVMHACGGYLRCVTRRVELLEGEPEDV